MTRLTLTTADPLTVTADALVVAAYPGADDPVAADDRFAALVPAATLAGGTGKPGSVTTIPVRRGPRDSIDTFARVRNVPRPVSYASVIPSRPTK